MPDFFTTALCIRDAFASQGFATQLGIPQVRGLILAYRTSPGQTTYLEINPKPTIDNINPNFIDHFAGVGFDGISTMRFEADDLEVDGISRAYTRQQLRSATYYIVDYDSVTYDVDGVTPIEVNGGFRCIYVTTIDQPATFNLVLRRDAKYDQRIA